MWWITPDPDPGGKNSLRVVNANLLQSECLREFATVESFFAKPPSCLAAYVQRLCRSLIACYGS